MCEEMNQKKSSNRKRPIRKMICFSKDEWDFILEKIKQSGFDTYSEYFREMAMKGYVIEIDYTTVKALTKEIGYISRNINQIAKQVNTSHHIYKEDMREIKELLETVWRTQRSILLK